MAQMTTVKLTDDLDGSKAAETVSFALDGKNYQIDLSAKNAKQFRKVLGDYIDAGRPVRPARPVVAGRGGRKSSRRSAAASPAEVREWAVQNGVPVSTRGRVSAEVYAQYAAALGG